MTKTNLPKNFEKILSAAQQMLGIMQEFSKEGKGNWSQAYEERWFKALEEFTSQIYANKEYENCLSYEDIRERIWNISAETGKSIKEITAGDLRQIVETIRANQSFNILKCIYVIQDLPRLKRCHWFTEGMSGAVHDYRYKSGWFRHSSNPELEAYVKNLTQLMKGESDDIGRRCLTAIDVYCMIDQETPLQVRFLLSVIATEGLLLGKDDRDF